jgi:hypothetical protein
VFDVHVSRIHNSPDRKTPIGQALICFRKSAFIHDSKISECRVLRKTSSRHGAQQFRSTVKIEQVLDVKL